MKKLTVIMIFCALTFGAVAQNHVDALRYSQQVYGGTARSLAMGNAFGALGADFSALSINPAGIGVYKGSEISFSPSIYVGKTTSDYAGQSGEDIKYNFNVSNVGIVFTGSPKRAENPWKGFQFGFGMNRIANFNSARVIEGPNTGRSLMYDYLLSANGVESDQLDPFNTQMAFNTYLIDTLGGPTSYFTPVPDGNTMQSKYIETAGSINEMVFTIGGNYNDKLYIGGTFGFPYLRYSESSTYKETNSDDTLTAFKQMTIHDNLETSGTGFNFKFGLIYRITDWVRIGASVHTPTFYNLTDKYSKEMSSDFFNGDHYSDESPQGRYDYKLDSPLRAVGSIAFVIGQYALISADYEFVDYSDARLRAKDYQFFEENNAIAEMYRPTSNIRVGAEVKLAPVSIRAGYQLNFSPYADDKNDGQRMAFSGGLGLRDKSYFIDLGYVYSKLSEDYYMYPSVSGPVVNNFSNHNIVLTLGFKF
jgi:long-subunit fatty acid transport protein